MATKICVVCGEEFSPKNKNQIACSHECQKLNKRQKDRERHHKNYALTHPATRINICAVCGKEFTPHKRNPHQITCSPECQTVRKKQIANEHYHIYCKQDIPPKSCIVCGKKFFPRDSRQKTCGSHACQKIYHEGLRKIWAQRNRDRWKIYRTTYIAKNPEKYREESKRHCHKSYWRDVDASRQKARERYWLNPDFYRSNMRQRYYKSAAENRIRDKLKRIDNGQKTFPFCSVCGKKFTPRYKGEKFCSPECRLHSPLYRILLAAESSMGY